MAIKASSAPQINTLIAQLNATDVRREAAVARLIVIGARAVDRLTAFASSTAGASARAAAFRALEAIADRRAIEPSVRAIADADAAVAVAAIGAARVFMRGSQGATVVDAVTAAALDSKRPEPVRLNAIRTLMDLERSTIAPLVRALAADPNAAVRALVAGGKAPADSATRRRLQKDPVRPATPIEQVARAADGKLPDDPQDLREILVASSNTAPLAALLRLVERIREREPSEPLGLRPEWTRARGAAHLALANRGSRLAVYDLRESLEAAEPLPVEFLAALALVGDASCLEPIAVAYARTVNPRREDDDWWRQHLADAFREIATRAKITRRHAVMKRMEKRWPTARELWAGTAGGAGKAG